MTRRRALMLVLFVGGCSEPLTPEGKEQTSAPTSPIGSSARLADMTTQQGLVVRLHSEGCFHNWNAELRLNRSPEGMHVEGKVWDRIDNEAVVPRVLGVLEVEALDEELAELRHAPREGWCTTTSTYDLAWRDANGAARTEHIEDSTCVLAQKYYFGPDSARGYPVMSFTMLAGEALYRRYTAK